MSRGSRRAERLLAEYGTEVADTRRSAGVSQRELGRRAGMSATKLGRIEAGRLSSLSLMDAARLAAVAGLDLHVRAYPSGPRLRDAAQIHRLNRILEHVRPPLIYRTEVVLPQRPDQPRELRAWDAIVRNPTTGTRTAIELETRLRDAQAVERRVASKRRDDPVENFLLVLADTRANRRLLAEFPHLFPDLPRLRPRAVITAISAGTHPPTGLLFV